MPGKKRCKPEEDVDDESLCVSDEEESPPAVKRGQLSAANSSGLNFDSELVGGIIKEIKLKNFMCHSNLEFKFGNKVNFITGRNGSGKSAVLAGIVLGLGGKASTMNRGRAIREYVKQGCHDCEISITLMNDGPDAYKPNQLGKEITVERKIVANGKGNGYKLKDVNGQVVSTKYADIVRMLDYYNIQLDNPITVLSQDTSRQFLQSMKPHNLYEYFMQATQLGQIQIDLQLIKTTNEEAQSMLETREAALPRARDEVEKLHKQVRRHESLDGLRDKLLLLFAEAAWSKVAFQENYISEYEKKLFADERQLSKLQSEEKSHKTKLEELEQERVDLNAEINDFMNSCEQTEQLYQRASDSAKQSKTSVDQKNGQIRINRIEFERQKREKGHLAEQLRNEENSDRHAERNRLKAEKEAELANVVNRLRDSKKKLDEFKYEAERVQRATDNNEASLREVERDCQNLDAKMSAVRRQIDMLNAATTNRLAKFGNKAPELKRLIDEAVKIGRFKKVPRGPLGMHVTMLDQHWALAVENCLGNLLKSYVVDNYDDNNVLMELMKRCYGSSYRPSIIKTEFGNERRYDIEPKSNLEYPTLLSVLKIDDSIAFNVLVDQRNIEDIVLMENDETMREIMYRRPPVKVAYSSSGSQSFASPDFRFYPPRVETVALLATDVGGALKQFTEQFQSMNVEYIPLTAKKNQLSILVASENSNVKKLKDEVNTTSRFIHELDGRERRLRRELEDLPILTDNSTVLQSEIELCSQQMAELQTSWESLKTELADLNASLKTMTDERDRLKQLRDRMHGDNESKRQRSEKIVDQLKQIRIKITKYQNEQSSIMESVDKSKREIAEGRAELDSFLTEATNLRPERPRSVRPVNVVEKEALRTQETLAISEKEIGDIEELKYQFEEKRSKLEKIERNINELKDFENLLAESIETRLKRFKSMSSMLSVQLKTAFQLNLMHRGYSGILLISHNKKTIEIKMFPRKSVKREDDDAGSLHDLKGLSGGERSFATVCFILSLWKIMDAPFRCLDEFDVFMDMVSRQKAMRMLIWFAKWHAMAGQFLLLTPMDIDSLKQMRDKESTVSLFQLEAPREDADERPSISRKRRAAILD